MNVDESLILRAAHTSEARAIASMSRLLVEHGLNWRWTPARVRHSIKDKETMVLVASIDGRLSGFAIMKFRDAESHLFLLAVAAKFQRTGIGRALLAWLENRAGPLACGRFGLRSGPITEMRGSFMSVPDIALSDRWPATTTSANRLSSWSSRWPTLW